MQAYPANTFSATYIPSLAPGLFIQITVILFILTNPSDFTDALHSPGFDAVQQGGQSLYWRTESRDWDDARMDIQVSESAC